MSATLRQQVPLLTSNQLHGGGYDFSGLRVTVLAVPMAYSWNKQHMATTEDTDWYAALQRLKASPEWDATRHDVVLLGCGAFAMPLAHHAKGRGLSAVNVAGFLPLIFGIHGKRHRSIPEVKRRIASNKKWTKPLRVDTPAVPRSAMLEGGAYW